MAETRLTNAAFDTDVFSDYTVQPSIYRSRLYRSGVIQENAMISGMLNADGESFNLPFWNDISGTTGDVPQEGTDQTVNALTSGKQIFRKQTRTKAWGTNDLVKVFAGSNPMDAAADMVNGYWAQAFDSLAIKSLTGVILDNTTNDSGDLVNDISGGTGAAAYFTDNGVIAAQGKLGENGAIGEAGWSAILVHPSTYEYMRELDLIDFKEISAQERPLERYMGMNVIVDRNAPLASTVYSTIILKAGALQFGVANQNYIPTELDRKPLDGFGIDQLITRRVFAIHPVGFAHQESGTAGITPTDAELVLAAAWDRVYNAENCPFVVLKHKLP